MNTAGTPIKSCYLLSFVMILASFSYGCQSLSGTQWTVAEFEARDDTEPLDLQNIRTVLVEFGSDGRLRTTVQYKDGKIKIEDDETYEAQDDTIIIRHPNYEKRLQYDRVGKDLLISSDEYELTLKRSVRTTAQTADRPAMFRPSRINDLVYRRFQEMRR